MTPGRIWLALDVGDAKIGVALSRSGMIAEPLETVERESKSFTLDAISRFVSTHGVTDIVIGLPIREDGDEGDQADKTRTFARSLKRRLPTTRYHFQDERYSSAEAADIRPDARNVRGGIDRLAAAVILRDFLARLSEKGDATKE